MKVFSVSEFRKVVSDVIDQIHYRQENVILSRHGKPWVMLVPLKEDDKDLQKFINKNVDKKTGRLK